MPESFPLVQFLFVWMFSLFIVMLIGMIQENLRNGDLGAAAIFTALTVPLAVVWFDAVSMLWRQYV